jgi:predicted DNA binding CopG/RHH family protein
MKKPLKLPVFKNEDEERDFWAKINLADYYEPEDAQHLSFPNLKPSSETISLRLSKSLLDQIKVEAHRRNVPYQSLIKVKLHELFG